MNGKLFNVVKGGQVSLHYLRMTAQVIKSFLKICLIIYSTISLSIFFYLNDSYDSYISFEYIKSYFLLEKIKVPNYNINLKLKNNKELKVSAEKFIRANSAIKTFEVTLKNINKSMLLSIPPTMFFTGLLVLYVNRNGKKNKEEKFLRGGQLVSEGMLNKTLKREGRGEVKLSNITIPYSLDTGSYLLIGDSLTGKTQILEEVLRGVIKNNKKAIVYDFNGQYIERFYREGRDIILNPLDVRSNKWSIWKEIKGDSQIIDLAEIIIPKEIDEDRNKVLASRLIFTGIFKEEAEKKEPSVSHLTDVLESVGLDLIHRFLNGFEKENIKKEPVFYLSIGNILKTAAKDLKFLNDNSYFSIKDWMCDDVSKSSIIFISCQYDQLRVLQPLIQIWINTAVKSFLSLRSIEMQRVYFIFDDLPMLCEIPDLDNFIRQQKRNSGCIFISFQSISQIMEKYNKGLFESITSACGVWVVFRLSGSESAKWASENLYQKDSIEVSEEDSFGANEIRDGVSVSRKRQIRSLVSYSEIQGLPDLMGYLRVGRGFPIAAFNKKIVEMPNTCNAFLEN